MRNEIRMTGDASIVQMVLDTKPDDVFILLLATAIGAAVLWSGIIEPWLAQRRQRPRRGFEVIDKKHA